MNNFKILLNNCSLRYPSIDIDYECLKLIGDKSFLSFIEGTNGGYFFDYSLHIYGFNNELNCHSYQYVNDLIENEYKSLLPKGLSCFACDVFGNQFGFGKKGIFFLNIETAEHEMIAPDFNGFINVLESEADYFTGFPILEKWNVQGNKMEVNERLVPLRPFVIGGGYEVQNLYQMEFQKVIKYNANIARQINDLPDGQEIAIKLID